MVELEAALDPAVLADMDTEALKALLLQWVESRDAEPMGQKARLVNERLLPLFQELEQRNPVPDVTQQIPLVQGIWRSVWSTIPFQDILPGRLHHQSYQIFADNGLYANLARYKPGHKLPILNRLSQWLLSYDLMILQTYGIGRVAASEDTTSEDTASEDTTSEATTSGEITSGETTRDHDSDGNNSNGPAANDRAEALTWSIQNVGIKQVLRVGARPFNPQAAQTWFDHAIATHQHASDPQSVDVLPQNVSAKMTKRYQKVFKSQPQLEHLYIDRDFRLVKSRREASQRPSYTIATRIQ